MRLSWDTFLAWASGFRAYKKDPLTFASCSICRRERRGEIGCASKLLEFDRWKGEHQVDKLDKAREEEKAKGDEGPAMKVTCFIHQSRVLDKVILRHNTQTSLE
jgi:hypothetical protein